jgi:hypothetical protein
MIAIDPSLIVLELIYGPWGQDRHEWQRHVSFITHKKSQLLGLP